jgi:hypothetical protein
MLDDPITRTVNSLPGAATDVTLARYAESTNRTTYVLSTTIPNAELFDTEDALAHTPEMRHQVQFYRTFAKRSGNSRGAKKAAMKLTRDVSVPNTAGDGDIVLPLIVEVSFSVPVGTDVAKTQDARHIIARLMQSDTLMQPFVDSLTI